MKLKYSFHGLLLSLRKRLKLTASQTKLHNDPELYLAGALVLLWLLLFLLFNLSF